MWRNVYFTDEKACCSNWSKRTYVTRPVGGAFSLDYVKRKSGLGRFTVSFWAAVCPGKNDWRIERIEGNMDSLQYCNDILANHLPEMDALFGEDEIYFVVHDSE